MKSKLFATAMAVGLSITGWTQSANAALMFFTDRPTFNTAAPGLPIEGFQNCNDTTVIFTGPLNSTSNNAFCSPGDIMAGISFVDNPGPDGNGMFSAATGQSSNPTQAVGQNSPSSDALDIIFAPGVTAVGFDIYQNFGGGSQSGSTQLYPVSVFDAANMLLGSTNVSVPSGGSGFFGVISDTDVITRVSVNNTSAFDVIDDVAFGTASIPEPGTLALFGLGLAGLGFARRRKAA
jgi:hypothetical protein